MSLYVVLCTKDTNKICLNQCRGENQSITNLDVVAKRRFSSAGSAFIQIIARDFMQLAVAGPWSNK